MGLPNLTSLPRGDFLCDALGWIDYLEEIDNPIFLIKDFFPSQSYYFHEAWQLELASRFDVFLYLSLVGMFNGPGVNSTQLCFSLFPIFLLSLLTLLRMKNIMLVLCNDQAY